ncbi:MAG TPA: PDZ domain-containing protein [Gemmatimonadales bacterium]|nr:PDZ domain-containing protein [Gemmatimonadales bacterium]
MRRLCVCTTLLLVCAGTVVAQRPGAPGKASAPAPSAANRSAPISNIRYDLAFDSATAARRTVQVAMSFDVGPGTAPILLSLPAWTPGAYEISNFARWASHFVVTAGGKSLFWDKADPDTWRIRPAGAGRVTVRFDYLADTLDNAMAWARPDFLLFNGTNLFPYAEGRGFDFPATVTVQAPADWLVVTSMRPTGQSRTWTERNYHDLVDMPFFVGHFDLDSSVVNGKVTRLATYPAGILQSDTRKAFWDQVAKAIPAMASVFQETPWDTYSVMMIFDSSYGGGSALEHQSSHVGIYNPMMIGTPLLASITAHEIFHAWNVKRLRPADMVPYEYERPEPTPWLWVSEGITDYYADLALVRGGIVDSAIFMGLTAEKIQTVSEAPPTALEDASVSTWIHPTDGSSYVYYPKGSLAGLLLDISIRDATDNRRSLDDVMRELYRTTYKAGRGFTGTDWWGTVSRASGGKSFTDFNARYVDGRDPYPYDAVLALAGFRLAADTIREPRLGLGGAADSAGVRITAVQPGSAAEAAGVRVGDVLLALGDVAISDPNFGPAYRARFRNAEGQDLPIKVRRGTDTLTLTGKVRLIEQVNAHVEPDPKASAKAIRVRGGILAGKTDKP